MIYINLDGGDIKELLCSVAAALGLEANYTVEREVDGKTVRESGTIAASDTKTETPADKAPPADAPGRININVYPIAVYPQKSKWEKFNEFMEWLKTPTD